MDKSNLAVDSSIIKIIGVFESENKKKELQKLLVKNQFKNEPIKDGADNTHKNLWYPEFRNMFILEKEDTTRDCCCDTDDDSRYAHCIQTWCAPHISNSRSGCCWSYAPRH